MSTRKPDGLDRPDSRNRWRDSQSWIGCLWLSILALGFVASSAAKELRPSGFGLADLDGRWIQLDTGVDAKSRRVAIDTAIRPLPWVVRKMAGGVLHTSTAPEPIVHFIWDGARLHQRLEGKRGVKTRAVEPGAPASTGLDSRGEPFEGRWVWTSNGLEFSWSQHQAHGANLYRVDPARRELTIDHSIHITALAGIEPIYFQSRFVQSGLPAVSAAGASEPE